MRIKEIHSKLRKFAIAATGLEEGKVISANQPVLTRPAKPYITIAASGFKNTGTPIEKFLSDNGEIKTTISIVFAASFQAFSDTPFEAEELLSDLYINFSTGLQSNIFNGDMAKRRTLKHVSAMPLILNQQVENRAILEVEMGYLKSVIEQVGLIEAVEMYSIKMDAIEMDGLVNQKIEIKRRMT